MFRYGEKVIIRDGSGLDGMAGLVYSVKDGLVQVLLDREVFWMVMENCLEPDHRHESLVAGLEVID